MQIEIHIQSTDEARPDAELLRQILDSQEELNRFLKDSQPEIARVQVEAKGGFPTGLEPFAIAVGIAFVTGVAEGFAEGVGEGMAKPIGKEIGERIGARIRQWIKQKFPDIVVK